LHIDETKNSIELASTTFWVKEEAARFKIFETSVNF